MNNIILNKISEDLCDLNIKRMFDHVNEALSEGAKPIEVIKYGLIEGINKLSTKADEGKAFLADIVYASNAVDLCCQMLIGGIRQASNKNLKSIVIGTVKGDMHQIGKNIAKYLLQAQGVNVLDLGCSVSDTDFAKAAEDKNVGMILCIGTLRVSKGQLKNIVQKIKLYRNDVYIAAAGDAFDDEIVNEYRADKYIKNIDEIISDVLEVIEIKEGV